jgi:hypothetical protein
LKFNVAVRVPVAVGPKITFAVQLAEGAIAVPQVWLNIWKSPGFVPVNVMLVTVIDEVLLFVSVTTFWPLLLPTGTVFQVRLVGEAVSDARQLVPRRNSSANGILNIDRINRTLASGLLRGWKRFVDLEEEWMRTEAGKEV